MRYMQKQFPYGVTGSPVLISSHQMKKGQDHLIHASNRLPGTCCSLFLLNQDNGKFESMTCLCTQKSDFKVPHFAVDNFVGISQDDP